VIGLYHSVESRILKLQNITVCSSICLACVALGAEVRHHTETIDLLREYVVQLRRYGHLQSVLQEVPAADGLTTAYIFQGRLLLVCVFIQVALELE